MVDILRKQEWLNIPFIDIKYFKNYYWNFNPKEFEFVRRSTILSTSKNSTKCNEHDLVIGYSNPIRCEKGLWKVDRFFLTYNDRRVLNLLDICNPKLNCPAPFYGYPENAVRFNKIFKNKLNKPKHL